MRLKNMILPVPGLFNHEGHIRTLAAIEAHVICVAVQHYRGNLTLAAKHLGVSRSTIYRKISEFVAGPNSGVRSEPAPGI